MKIRNLFLLTASFLFIQQGLTAQDNTILIKTQAAKDTISRHIYGHFSEHLGRCIYDGIWVGEDSPIPNINGYRKEIVEALQEIEIPNLRWPGGCFADTYHWKDGIGPREERPSIVNVHWGGVTEDNSFGTHEFLNFCELIGTEPYLSINVGSGTVQEATEWVEYVTSSNESPMTALRKQNGREEPWDVKFWGIGNETWGCGGEMTPEYYANIYRHYAGYVRGKDFQKVICGPASGDLNWTEKIMAGLEGKMHLTQGVSLHHYTLPTGSWTGSKGSSTEFGEEMYFNTIRNTLEIEDHIVNHQKIIEKYAPEGNVKLMVDEWGTWYDELEGTKSGFLQQQNTVRDALVAGINLNIFNNHADFVSMANIAQIVNVLQAIILTKGPEIVKTPTFHVFKMYKVHQDALLMPTEVKCDDYSYGDESLPAITASASKSKTGEINLSLTNVDLNNSKTTSIKLDTEDKIEVLSASIITADDITTYNDFDSKDNVIIKEFSDYKTKGKELILEIPAKSVVTVSIK